MIIPAQQLASDNNAGVCPEALASFVEANAGHVPGYGDDHWTAEACNLVRELFERDCEVFFVFNGTAANALALASLCQSYHSVICHETAHIETDECGAPEFFSNGSKVLTAPGSHGKLKPETVERIVTKRTDIHYPRPKVLSVTQATEAGTVYTREELLALRAVANKHDLRIHMDGARLANAIASLDVAPRTITWECGIDVLCFGGTKNGLPVGDMVIFFDRKLAVDFAYRCKQAGQLASKMRYLSAPWLGLLRNGVWLDNARKANAAAARLESGIKALGAARLLFPREANSVFVELPPAVQSYLRAQGWRFYTFIGEGGARLMCSWDMTEETIDRFLEDLVSAPW